MNIEASARAARRRQAGAARRRSPVQLGVDAARPVAAARLSRGRGVQAAGRIRGPSARCSPSARASAAGSSPAKDLLAGHHQASQGRARHRHGRGPGADHQRAQALDALPEPRHGVLHGRGGDRARRRAIPVFFIGMRRTARGFYEMTFKPLVRRRGSAHDGRAHRALRAAVEEQIRAAPPDWPWSHKRWRLKKGLYGKAGSGAADAQLARQREEARSLRARRTLLGASPPQRAAARPPAAPAAPAPMRRR